MLNWLKNKLGFAELESEVKRLKTQVSHLRTMVSHLKTTVNEQTTLHLDWCPNGRSTVIVIGRYQNRDYIQTYEVTTENFNHIVDLLRRERKAGRQIGYIDAPPVMRAVIDRDLGL